MNKPRGRGTLRGSNIVLVAIVDIVILEVGSKFLVPVSVVPLVLLEPQESHLDEALQHVVVDPPVDRHVRVVLDSVGEHHRPDHYECHVPCHVKHYH